MVRATKACLETVNRYEENHNADEATKQTLKQMVHQVKNILDSFYLSFTKKR